MSKRIVPAGGQSPSASPGVRNSGVKALIPKREHVQGWSTSDTGTSSSSGGGPGRSPRAIMRAAYKHKLKPRTILYGTFAAIELVCLAAFLLAITATTRAIYANYEEAATDSIHTVHEAVKKKADNLKVVVVNTAFNKDVQRFVNTPGPGDKEVVALLCEHIQRVFEVEYVAVLDVDFKITYSVNPYNNHETEEFNPNGIVEAARTADMTVYATAVLRYADFMNERPPLFRDRENGLDMAMVGHSPYETKKDSVVRWIATPVYNLNGLVRPPSSAPSGYIIIGEVMTGKASLTSLTSSTIGGYAAVYANMGPADPKDPEKQVWGELSASAKVVMSAYSREARKRTVTDVLIEGFDPYEAMQSDAVFDDVMADEHARARKTVVEPYQLAARKWKFENGSEVANPQGPQLVLARGIPVDTLFMRSYVTKMWSGLAGVALLDLLTLVAATFLFLSPLETMGKRVRAGQPVDFGYLQRLTKRKYCSVIVAAVGLASLAVGVVVAKTGSTSMETAVRQRSGYEPGVMALSWRRDIDGCVQLARSVQPATCLHNVIADPADDDLRTFARDRLLQFEALMNIEFALLMDKDGKVIVAPNDYELKNIEFDPALIVAKTLENGIGYTRTGLIPAEELIRFKSSKWPDKWLADTPDSKLHPIDTGAEALIRWTTTPMFPGGALSGTPYAVILTGDVVNGKTRIPENSNLEKGYSGIYYLNSTGHYNLATAVLRQPNGTFEVDVELPSTSWLEKLRYDLSWLKSSLTHVTVEMKFQGVKYEMSAQCMTKDTYVNDDGFNADYETYNGTATSQCTVFLVHGMPWSEVAAVLRPGYAWQGVFIAVCVLKVLAMGALCYRAYVPFHKIVVNNKFVQSKRQTGNSYSMNSAKINATNGATAAGGSGRRADGAMAGRPSVRVSLIGNKNSLRDKSVCSEADPAEKQSAVLNDSASGRVVTLATGDVGDSSSAATLSTANL